MRPEPNGQTAFVDGYFVFDFIGVDSLRADGAGLACPLPCPHARWQGHKDPSLKAIKYGLEKGPFRFVVGAAGQAPPRVQPTAVELDEDLGVTEARAILRDEFPRARDPDGC